jgi:hypothetical protein
MSIDQRLKEVIEYYTGKKITKLSVVADPQVSDTYAMQCNFGKRICTFLITRFNSRCTAEEGADLLEEVEFESWPPCSGRLQFF